tara:strand:- start:59 stop:226 length:168 start_codon:yes stop_codon:yes gene_type:complete
MGMHREFTVTCDDCQDASQTERYADDAKRAAAEQGWKVYGGSNEATCPECQKRER